MRGNRLLPTVLSSTALAVLRMRDWIPIIAGPTAVGKTALGIELAERLDAEIISADSRQIYCGLDIGTAKPSPSELERVPHHFVDELELTETYSAGRFQADAYIRIKEILKRKTRVIVVGGSTLYLHALKHRLADIPDVPSSIREDIAMRLATEGAEALFGELLQIDPEAAATMDHTKTQRLVRALEVYHATGRPISSYHRNLEPPPFNFRTFVLNRDRQQLYDRINERVERMLEAGLLEEVRALLRTGIHGSVSPLRTIGYREVIDHLQDEISYGEMVRRIKRNTRRYAKRQLTWFRRDPDNVWLDADRSLDELADKVLEPPTH